jgi:hypothetical protein
MPTVGMGGISCRTPVHRCVRSQGRAALSQSFDDSIQVLDGYSAYRHGSPPCSQASDRGDRAGWCWLYWLAWRSALRLPHWPGRIIASTDPVMLLRRNSSPDWPFRSRALACRPSGSVTIVPAVR